MEFLKKSIHMDQIGCEEQTQITLEDDVNIADAKPDVYQVVTQQGHVELEEVRASDGHVHVKGVLHFKVLYLADEETHHPACMEGELAFEEQILMGSVSGTDQVQAQAILEQQKQILGDAKAEADRTADKADEIYTTTVEKAKQFEQEVKADADAYDKQIRQKAQEDSSAIVADANTRAEQIIFNAQQQSQKLVEDNEITRRAQAYAVETRERAEKDADSIYNQACVQVDKMLSGAAAALSRSASELAALRDNLLTQGSAQQQDR